MTASSSLFKLTSSRLIGPLAMSLAILVLAVSELGLNRLEAVSDQRSVSVQAQLSVGRLRRVLLSMESTQRGYLLTGRADYLQPYQEQEEVFKNTLVDVANLKRQDDGRRVQLAKVLALSNRRHAELTELLRLYRAGQGEAALSLMLADAGPQLMMQINEIVDQVLRDESVYQDQTTELRKTVVMYSRIGIWLLVLLCIVGALMLMRLGREQERERRVHLLQLLAERDRLDEEVSRQTAETIDLAQHMEKVREDERARLARELHDELGGLLTSAKLDAARMRKRIVDDTGMLQELLAHLIHVLDTGIAVKRQIIEDLRPSSLSNLGLQRTLEIQCAEFSQRAEVALICEIDDVKLPPDRALAVYRLVQEALTNVAKYARASQIRVTLKKQGDQAEVVVEDDGKGFDKLKSNAGGGHGLQGMRFRIRACGGDVQIRSSPGQGTMIKALLPL